MSLLTFVWMSTFILTGIFSGGESVNLRFYHRSLLNYTTTPVEEPLTLLPFFDKNLVSLFYISEYVGTELSEDARMVLSAYLETGNTNVILVDCADDVQATAGIPFTYSFSAVPNVGRALGKALVTIIKNGISADRTHIVGFSLGAHIGGYAGEVVKDSNLKIARITGLDPAGPLFGGAVNNGGLTPSAAKFVDVLHTNPGQYGINASIGSVDLWANCEYEIQPGCVGNTLIMGDSNSFCEHQVSFKYFTESILRPLGFIAIGADNCTSRLNQSKAETIYLGDMVDTSARGNYYFSTESQTPYFKGQAGLVPNN